MPKMPTIAEVRENIAQDFQREILSIPLIEMQEVISYAIEGKKSFFWATIICAAYEASGEHDFNRIKNIVLAAEMYNMATVILDDIVEDHAVRRGRPSAYYSYGAPRTILTALYLMNRAHILLQEELGAKNFIAKDIASACIGWYEKDIKKHKTLNEHLQTLENITSFPIAFIRSVVDKNKSVYDPLLSGLQHLLLAQIILDECKDLVGEFGRRKAEEFLHGIDTVLTLKAVDLGLEFEHDENVWKNLKETPAYRFTKDLVLTHINQVETHFEHAHLNETSAPMLIDLLQSVKDSSRFLES